MTEAQQLTAQFHSLPPLANRWKWAQRVTAQLVRLPNSKIGYLNGRTAGIAVFRCADGSRFGYDLDGAAGVWAMPAE